MSEPSSPIGPRVWLLTDDKPGNRTQALGVARALGLPFEEKRLVFNDRQDEATARLGASLDTLTEEARALIAPPYPDLVIAAGRRAVPVARWVREAGGGAKIALVGRKTPDSGADLTIRTAYLKQAPSDTLFELTLPLTQVDAEALEQAARNSPDPLEGLPAPRTVFLVGGLTGQHSFEDSFAERMAHDIAMAVALIGGSLAILTSRRTPLSAIAAIRRAAPDARIIEWTPDAPFNPVLPSLARADFLVVTGESESMLAEGVASGKPLTIYPLIDLPTTLKNRIRNAIADGALGDGPLSGLCRRIMADGWVTPRRDLNAMHALLEERGWAKRFDGVLNRTPPKPDDERAALRARLLALLEP